MDSSRPSIEHTPASIRTALGLSAIEVAQRAGVHTDTLRALERGDSVTVKTVREVAAVYGLTPDALLRAMEAADGPGRADR